MPDPTDLDRLHVIAKDERASLAVTARVALAHDARIAAIETALRPPPAPSPDPRDAEIAEMLAVIADYDRALMEERKRRNAAVARAESLTEQLATGDSIIGMGGEDHQRILARAERAEAALSASLTERARLTDALANVERERAQAEESEQRMGEARDNLAAEVARLARALGETQSRAAKAEQERDEALVENRRLAKVTARLRPTAVRYRMGEQDGELSEAVLRRRLRYDEDGSARVLCDGEWIPAEPGNWIVRDYRGELAVAIDKRDAVERSSAPVEAPAPSGCTACGGAFGCGEPCPPPGVVPVPAFTALEWCELAGAGAYTDPSRTVSARTYANGEWSLTFTSDLRAPDEPSARRMVEELHRRVGAPGVDPAALVRAFFAERQACGAITDTAEQQVEAMRRALPTVGATVATPRASMLTAMAEVGMLVGLDAPADKTDREAWNVYGNEVRAAVKAALSPPPNDTIELPVTVEYEDDGRDKVTATIVDADGSPVARMLTMDVAGCTDRKDAQAEAIAAALNRAAPVATPGEAVAWGVEKDGRLIFADVSEAGVRAACDSRPTERAIVPLYRSPAPVGRVLTVEALTDALESASKECGDVLTSRALAPVVLRHLGPVALTGAAPARTVTVGAPLVAALETWCSTFGEELKPKLADTYGEGMRDAKEQVRDIIAAHLGATLVAGGEAGE